MNFYRALRVATVAYLTLGSESNPSLRGTIESERSLQSMDDDYAYGYGSNSGKMQLINSNPRNALVITSSPTGSCSSGQYCNAFILPGGTLSIPIDSWSELTGNGIGVKSCYSSSVVTQKIINQQGQVTYYYDCAVSTINAGVLQYSDGLSGEVVMGQGELDIARQYVTPDPQTDTYTIIFSLGNCPLEAPATYADNTLRTLAIGGSERDNPVFPDDCFINNISANRFNGFEIQIAPASLLNQISSMTDDLGAMEPINWKGDYARALVQWVHKKTAAGYHVNLGLSQNFQVNPQGNVVIGQWVFHNFAEYQDYYTNIMLQVAKHFQRNAHVSLMLGDPLAPIVDFSWSGQGVNAQTWAQMNQAVTSQLPSQYSQGNRVIVSSMGMSSMAAWTISPNDGLGGTSNSNAMNNQPYPFRVNTLVDNPLLNGYSLGVSGVYQCGLGYANNYLQDPLPQNINSPTGQIIVTKRGQLLDPFLQWYGQQTAVINGQSAPTISLGLPIPADSSLSCAPAAATVAGIAGMMNEWGMLGEVTSYTQSPDMSVQLNYANSLTSSISDYNYTVPSPVADALLNSTVFIPEKSFDVITADGLTQPQAQVVEAKLPLHGANSHGIFGGNLRGAKRAVIQQKILAHEQHQQSDPERPSLQGRVG